MRYSKGWAILSEACKRTTTENKCRTPGRCILARMLALALCSRKGSLGCGSPGTRRSEVDGKAHCGPT